MKKTLSILYILSLCFSSTPAFAQMPMSVPGMMPVVSPALERVGVVAAAQGKVKLRMPGEAGHLADSGEPVFISQEVATDSKGHLQILLLDETIFTIGPNSSITIDKFVYDSKSHAGEIRASILAGVFRYVSGKIAAKKSDSVSVKLPNATIGFRGTIVGGQVNPGGGGLVALLGPGDNNDANARIGSFTVEGVGGDSQDVNRSGFGVEVGATGGLSGVFQLSNEQVNNLTSGLMPSSGSGSQAGGTNGSQPGGSSGPTGGAEDQGGTLGGGDMSTLSGETGAITAETSSLTGSLTNLTADLDMASNQAAQDAAATNEKVPNGITTYEQLTRIRSGVSHYDFSGTFSGGGDVEARIVINFADQTIVGGNSYIRIIDSQNNIAQTIADGYGGQPFSSISNGSFHWPEPLETVEAVNKDGYRVGEFSSVDVVLNNAGGNTAQQATLNATYVADYPSAPIKNGTTSSMAGTLQSGS